MNNLPEIRDIHIPDGVSFLPLAYGWWVILAVIVIGFFIFWGIMLGIKTSRKYYAFKTLKEIDTQNPITAAIKISELLKRICISKYKTASALYGKEWIDFLNNHTSLKLNGNATNLLMYAPFVGDKNFPYTVDEANELKRFAKIWIGENL